MTYKTVLFDMDGTLLDTLSDMHDAVNHILAENGWAARSREEIRAFVGNGARKLMERAIPETLAPQRFEEVLADYKLSDAESRRYSRAEVCLWSAAR